MFADSMLRRRKSVVECIWQTFTLVIFVVNVLSVPVSIRGTVSARSHWWLVGGDWRFCTAIISIGSETGHLTTIRRQHSCCHCCCWQDDAVMMTKIISSATSSALTNVRCFAAEFLPSHVGHISHMCFCRLPELSSYHSRTGGRTSGRKRFWSHLNN